MNKRKCKRCDTPLPENVRGNRKYCLNCRPPRPRPRGRCIGCGKEINYRATRCQSCATKKDWEDGIYDSEEIYQKRAEGIKRAWENGAYDGMFTEEARQKLSEAIRKRWEDPEYQHQRSEATKKAWENGIYDGIFDSEEYRQKLSEIMKRAWKDGIYGSEEYRRKKSEASKRAWKDGAFDSEETRRKMSEATKKKWEDGIFDSEEVQQKRLRAAKKAWKDGAYDNRNTKEYRQKLSEAKKKDWENGVYDGVYQSPTSIELATATALDICGIEHVTQYRPDGYSRIYDEFILPNILIELQGDYWHGPKKPEQQKRDAKKAAWAKENGYHLVVIWEHEIKEQNAYTLVHERVLPLLNGELEDKKDA